MVCARTAPDLDAGVVAYALDADGGLVASWADAALAPTLPGGGAATRIDGDPGDFVGSFEIQYTDADGNPAGPVYTLAIAPQGECLSLSWTSAGDPLVGVGVVREGRLLAAWGADTVALSVLTLPVPGEEEALVEEAAGLADETPTCRRWTRPAVPRDRGVPADGAHREAALALVEALQARLVDRLCAAVPGARFDAVSWQRDGGRHGGGTRLQAAEGEAFDRASVNVSQVHYDDLPDRALASATALSSIVHPRHPRAPSMHIHTSWTALKDGTATWRIMADLNPSHPDEAATATFRDALRAAAGPHAAAAEAQGDRYFAIPALGRTRGVAHFYMEGHDSGDFDADLALARRVETAAIDTYARLVAAALDQHGPPTAGERRVQLHYHTLYLFQVLTLDRGTTSGLMVHGDNDVGILGSLPSHVDRDLLASWAARCPAPQDRLVHALVDALPGASPSPVTVDVKRALARAVRAHYRAHPDALALQARGDVLPPTVQNHR
ncbi:MAG: coproporphyrinogen III oxidase [Alphaproteobacteria bacterium]|nr:coproporphyrinogen III oxidase [Alphaproteobacteria bacterium]